MFIKESLWIKNQIQYLKQFNVKTALDAGSADNNYRKITQPHIYKNIYLELKKLNIEIKTLDFDYSADADYIVDISGMNFVNEIKIIEKFDFVLCCNLLEHTKDIEQTIKNIIFLLNSDINNKFLLITVPQKYFYHPDPIDNNFRPSTEELILILSKFIEYKIIAYEIIRIDNIKDYILNYSKNNILKYIPFIKYRKIFHWIRKSKRWKVSCVFIEITKFI